MKNQIDWSRVWRDMSRWFNNRKTVNDGWRAQQNKIRELVEAQLKGKP